MTAPLRRVAPQGFPCVPMTPEAEASVRAEVASLEAELSGMVTGASPASRTGSLTAKPVLLPSFPLRRRLELLHEALAGAVIEHEPGVAVVGRRITITNADGARETFALVLAGDGDPARGWVSIDAPLGAALTGRRAGEQAIVEAPGGDWAVVVEEVR